METVTLTLNASSHLPGERRQFRGSQAVRRGPVAGSQKRGAEHECTPIKTNIGPIYI